MTVFPASIEQVGGLFTVLPRSSDLGDTLGRMTQVVPAALTLPLVAGSVFSGMAAPFSTSTLPAVVPAGVRDFWFDRIHVIPRFITLGNVLSTVQRTLDVYNAFITTPKDLQAVVSTLGTGSSITNLPALPAAIPPQRSLLLTLEVTTAGIPAINGTLQFDTSEPYLVSVPITGSRVVIFPFEPEVPVTERLQFLTDVLQSKGGIEQRISLRIAPRQEFDMRFVREDGPERQRIENLIFDWQSRVFGLPVWTEPATTTAAITVGQTSISVDSTANADFRVDGLAIIYASETSYEAVEVASIGGAVINTKSPIQTAFPAGTRVMPLRTAITTQPVSDRRYAVNAAEYRVNFRVTDNTADLSSASGWPTYNSKVLLSDPNAIEQSLDGQYDRQIQVFDNGTGSFSLASTIDRAMHGSAKTFVTRTRSGLWSVRRLLHHIRGSQISFYLPTFGKDITLSATYTSGSPALTIVNVGYTRFAKQRTPRRDVRILLRNGTTYVRVITSSSEVNADVEQLTLDSSIAATFTPDDVERIEFIEPVRMDGDEVTITHSSDTGEARVSFPVLTVME